MKSLLSSVYFTPFKKKKMRKGMIRLKLRAASSRVAKNLPHSCPDLLLVKVVPISKVENFCTEQHYLITVLPNTNYLPTHCLRFKTSVWNHQNCFYHCLFRLLGNMSFIPGPKSCAPSAYHYSYS